MKEVKEHGRVYTPDYLVRDILDYGGYVGKDSIIGKHVIDNSCGDGAFLTEIVRRYCESYKQENDQVSGLKKDLEKYIHGIELDEAEWGKCLENLDEQVLPYGLSGVKWDVINADTLTVSKYNGKMDYVVGNPPYVRVHNLDESFSSVKQYQFAQGGMTDLFLVFFEIGFRMMSREGVMCLITPSSWLTSVAGGVLRKYILQHHCLNGVIDLAHYQAFNATTYTLISRYSWAKSDVVEYNTFNTETLDREFRCDIPLEKMSIGDAFYLADGKSLENLRNIRLGNYPQKVRVKNGFATLADGVFIGDWSFSGMTIDVIKSSTGKWYKCIFPYDENSKPIPLERIEKDFPDVYEYYLLNKSKLCKEDKNDKEQVQVKVGEQLDLFGEPVSSSPKKKGENNAWYLFGRSQAINDVRNDKISINSVIKDVGSVKVYPVGKGKGVYGGLYMLSSATFEEIESIVRNEEFVSYIAMLKNYKSGGYYTCSAKDIELYINYKLSQNEQH